MKRKRTRSSGRLEIIRNDAAEAEDEDAPENHPAPEMTL